MNIYQVVVLSLGCILGLLICGNDAQGYYPYSYYGSGRGSESGTGGAFFAFIGLIVIIIVLFGGFNRNTGTNTIAVMNVTG